MSNLPLKALIKRLYQYLVDYASAYLEYYAYEAAERLIRSIAYVVSNALVLILVSICLNITFLAVVLAIGLATQALPTALGAIAVFYFLVGAILLLFRRALILKPLQKQLVALLFDNPPS
jgi:ABC-type uncharacterized transport system permease subunit